MKRIIVAIAVAAMLVACGGDKNGTTTSNGTDTGNRTTSPPAAGKKLSDCDYAAALVQSLETFSTSVPSVTAVGSKEDALKAFDTFDSELGTLVSELKSYQLSSDVATVNSGVVAIFEDARGQITELKSAVQSGDTARLTTAGVTLSEGIVPRLEALHQQHPGVMAKLNKCEA